MSRKLRLVAAAFIIFVVPLTLILSMFWGLNLLGAIEKSEAFIDPPIDATVSYTLYSHQGDTLSPDILRDKVHVVHFYRPSCGEPCLPRLRKIRDMQYAISKFKHFRILSHCQEPVADRNEIWSFSRRINNYPSWHFVYGDTSEIAGLMESYGLAERKFSWGSPEEVALVDMEGGIRGYYNPMDSVGFRNLVNDIVFLLRKD